MKLQLKFGLFTFKTMSVFLSTIPENNDDCGICSQRGSRSLRWQGCVSMSALQDPGKKIYRVQIPVKKNIQQLSKFGT